MLLDWYMRRFADMRKPAHMRLRHLRRQRDLLLVLYLREQRDLSGRGDVSLHGDVRRPLHLWHQPDLREQLNVPRSANVPRIADLR